MDTGFKKNHFHQRQTRDENEFMFRRNKHTGMDDRKKTTVIILKKKNHPQQLQSSDELPMMWNILTSQIREIYERIR